MYISKLKSGKVLLNLDNYAHFLKHVVRVNYLVFNLAIDDIIICFLSPNVTSVIQPLDQGVIALFKV